MTGKMNVLDPSGHTEVAWRTDVPETVNEARVRFEDLMTKGWTAVVSTPGAPAEKLTGFRPEVEEMTLIPHLVGG